jgi:hypothetical protein
MKFHIIFLLAGASSVFAGPNPTPPPNLEERAGGNSNGVGNANGVGNCDGNNNCNGIGNGNGFWTCDGSGQCNCKLPVILHVLCGPPPAVTT